MDTKKTVSVGIKYDVDASGVKQAEVEGGKLLKSFNALGDELGRTIPAVQKVNDKLAEMKTSANNVSKALDSLGDEARQSFDKANQGGTKLNGILVGAVAGAVTSLIAQFVQMGNQAVSAIQAVKAEAINLNASLESSRVSFTQILGSEGEADRFIQRMKAFSTEIGVSTDSALGFARSLLPDAKDQAQLEELMVVAQTAANGAGRTIDDARFSFEEMLSGSEESLKDRLNIPPETVRRIKELAKDVGMVQALITGLGERFGKTGDSITAFSDTYSATMGRIASKTGDIQAAFGEDLFANAKEQASELEKFLTTNSEVLGELARQFGGLVASVEGVGQSALLEQMEGIKPETLTNLAESLDGISRSLDAISKIKTDGSIIDTFLSEDLTAVIDTIKIVTTGFSDIKVGIDDSLASMGIFGAYTKQLWKSTGQGIEEVLIPGAKFYNYWKTFNQDMENVTGKSAAEHLHEQAIAIDENARAQDKLNAVQAQRWAGSKLPEAVSGFGGTVVTEEMKKAQEEYAEAIEKRNKAEAELETDSRRKLEQLDTDFKRDNLKADIEYEREKLKIAEDGAREREKIALDNQRAIEAIYTKYQQDVKAAARDLSREQQKIATDYGREMSKIDTDAARKRTDIETDYRRKLAEIRNQFNADAEEAARNQDAIAFLAAKRRKDEEIATAQQDRADSIADAQTEQARAKEDAATQRAQEQQDAQTANQQKLEDLRINLQEQLDAQAEKNAQSLADQQLAEAQALADQQKAEEQKRADMQTKYQQSLEDARIYYNAKLADLKAALEKELSLIAEYDAKKLQKSSKGVSSAGGTNYSGWQAPGRASGGYVGRGLYEMGELGNEFVLNATTTRALESGMGSLSQSSILQLLGQARGNVNYNPQYTFNDRDDSRVIVDTISRQVDEKLLRYTRGY